MSVAKRRSGPDTEGGSEAAPAVGQRLRAERERQRIGVRELSRRVGVSASLISQIELGRATPSVATLYSIVQALEISLDELFLQDGDAEPGTEGEGAEPNLAGAPAPERALPSSKDNGFHRMPQESPLVRRDERHEINLESGITWARMNPLSEPNVDFLYVTYGVGSASAPAESLIRHGGREYGHLLEGRLGVTIGFHTYELEPGDAISFDSTTPHRLFNLGDVPARAIWFVIGRQDLRAPSSGPAASSPAV